MKGKNEMKSLKNFFEIVDVHMIIVTVLSLILTYLCLCFGFQSDLPSGFVGIAIVFPVVFSINAAYRRREQALGYFADLKAHLVSLYYAHRDWVPETKTDASHRDRFRSVSLETLTKLHLYLKNTQTGTEDNIRDIYRQFSAMSELNEEMRTFGVPANEVSRANQYVRAVIIDFEKLRNICLYRTPIPLRAYSRIFLSVFPVIFGPFFAHIAKESYPAVGYVLAVLYSVVLVSLDHIQEDLENPFDEIGEDDIRLDVREEYETIMSEN